jgi:cytochrome c
MKSGWILIAGAGTLGVALQVAVAQSPGDTGAAPKVKYADVQKVFTVNCLGCHSGAHPRGKIDLSSYESVMKGGEDGPIVVAGNPKKSPLYMAVSHSAGFRPMPPSGVKLPDKDIAKIEQWIKDGAKK